jgi:DNA-binding MarR family transcriptional regulator
VRAAAVVGAAGLKLPQFNTLRILRGAGEPLPIMEIRRRLSERTPGITRFINGLERMKLVTRCPCDTDRRATMCAITDAGLARLGQLDGPMADSDAQALADLSKADVAQLTALLRRIR